MAPGTGSFQGAELREPLMLGPLNSSSLETRPNPGQDVPAYAPRRMSLAACRREHSVGRYPVSQPSRRQLVQQSISVLDSPIED